VNLGNLFRSDADFSAGTLVTLGKSTVITQRGSEDLLEKQEKTVQETVEPVKETYAKLWDFTVKATKKPRATLHKSMEKFYPK